MKHFNKNLIITSIILIASVVSFGTQAKPKPSPINKSIQAKSFTLQNGMQVVLIPNHRAPVVHHAIWYKIGSADSPVGKTGLAHFLEHLMFKGTKKYPNDSFKKIISKFGGVHNAVTSYDSTEYYVTIAKEYLGKVMELEADRMQNLVLTPKIVAKEKQVVLQERRETVESDPSSKVLEGAFASYFWQHPYGNPVIGFKNHIEDYSLEDAISFYKNWYAPNNAILVVSGDVTLEEIKTLANKYYAGIAIRKLPKRIRLAEPDHQKAKFKVEIRDPQVNSLVIQRLYNAPNHRTGGMKEMITLELLSEILGDSSRGRLQIALVEQQGIAHGASCNYYGDYLDPLTFSITTQPVNTLDRVQAEAVTEAEVQRLIGAGISEEELQKSKQDIKFSFRYYNDSLTSLGNYIGQKLAHGINLKDTLRVFEIIDQVTTKDVQQAANKYLKQGPEVTIYTYPISYN